jgi:hypothetical protein
LDGICIRPNIERRWKKIKKKKSFFFLFFVEFFLLVVESLHLMQFCLDFRTFFFVEWILKSELLCKKEIAKRSYHFSLADGMVDKDPASVRTLEELIGL